MLLFDLIAEQKIAEAIRNGELSNLPGEGKPLDLDDDPLVPEDLRMAYRILKNAGFVPPEVEYCREIGELERCIEALAEGEARDRASKKLQLLRLRLAQSRRGCAPPGTRRAYLDKLLARLG